MAPTINYIFFSYTENFPPILRAIGTWNTTLISGAALSLFKVFLHLRRSHRDVIIPDDCHLLCGRHDLRREEN